MSRLTAPAAVLIVFALAGCSSPAPSPTVTLTAESSATNDDACVYLVGGGMDDALDFFETYATNPGAADPDELTELLDKLGTARTGATGDLAPALDDVITVFEDIQERYTGDDPLHPVAYEDFPPAMNRVIDACEAAVS